LSKGLYTPAAVSIAHHFKPSTSQDIAYRKPGRPVLDPIRTSAIVPGVFGSYAIPMRNFPVSRKWARVDQLIEKCASDRKCGGTKLARIASSAEGVALVAALDVVNVEVNRALRYRRDILVYGKFDYWPSPAEILSKGSGDCEDYVILKMAVLRRLGIPASSMSLVVLQIHGKNAFHAVLSVATNNGILILDNVMDTVRSDKTIADYVPLFSLSTSRAWIHGKRAGTTEVAEASTPLSAVAPGEGTDGPQWAASLSQKNRAEKWEMRTSTF
jgi:predicted transglutaminase-like cysteine proteinase